MVRTLYVKIIKLLNYVICWVVMGIINVYQYLISPFFPPCCKFNPSCSEYTKLAIIKYGVVKGTYLGAIRLLQCQPLFNFFNHN